MKIRVTMIKEFETQHDLEELGIKDVDDLEIDDIWELEDNSHTVTSWIESSQIVTGE